MLHRVIERGFNVVWRAAEAAAWNLALIMGCRQGWSFDFAVVWPSSDTGSARYLTAGA
jgi:hypothetical protein